MFQFKERKTNLYLSNQEKIKYPSLSYFIFTMMFSVLGHLCIYASETIKEIVKIKLDK